MSVELRCEALSCHCCLVLFEKPDRKGRGVGREAPAVDCGDYLYILGRYTGKGEKSVLENARGIAKGERSTARKLQNIFLQV